MKLGKNLQYLRTIHENMTQEELAEKLNVSRQTISKWELNQGNPEVTKIEELCKLFNCSADNLLFENMSITDDSYSEIKIENIDSFRYIKYTVISPEPEADSINKVNELAKYLSIENAKIIGWNFPYLSQEQINVYHMHGYTAALVLPDNIALENPNFIVEEVKKRRYATITIKDPMTNPFYLISNAYKSVNQFIKFNKYDYDKFDFETMYQENDIDYMKICIAIKEKL